MTDVPGCKKVEADIEKVEKEIKDVVKRLETTEERLETTADLAAKEDLKKKEEHLRKKEEQLREDKKQLRKKEEQLRNEKEQLRNESPLAKRPKLGIGWDAVGFIRVLTGLFLQPSSGSDPQCIDCTYECLRCLLKFWFSRATRDRNGLLA